MERQRLWDEPSLEELLGDEIMEVMLRSAKVTREELRHRITEIALRVRRAGVATSRNIPEPVRE